MKLGVMFSGMGGVETGAIMAGVQPVWGIEHIPKLAEIASKNLGLDIIVADVLDVDPSHLEPVDILHASPPCPSFSNADPKSSETELDIALAQKVAQFIRVLAPRYVTLENVYGWRKSKSWALIAATLTDCGYWSVTDKLNSADYGVPQTRERFVVRAAKGVMLTQMTPTDRESDWVSWYEAIEDLLPGLENTKFAPWQLRLLNAKHPARAFLVNGGGNANKNMPKITIRGQDEPSFVVVKSVDRCPIRAYTGHGGRVVKISPRCLARFQSFPDDMSRILSTEGIGNAVPPLLYEEILRQTT